MAAGDFENLKAFEHVTTQNVRTIGAYTKETRKLIRDLAGEVKELKNMIITRGDEVGQLRLQVSLLQAKLYKNGTA